MFSSQNHCYILFTICGCCDIYIESIYFLLLLHLVSCWYNFILDSNKRKIPYNKDMKYHQTLSAYSSIKLMETEWVIQNWVLYHTSLGLLNKRKTQYLNQAELLYLTQLMNVGQLRDTLFFCCMLQSPVISALRQLHKLLYIFILIKWYDVILLW